MARVSPKLRSLLSHTTSSPFPPRRRQGQGGLWCKGQGKGGQGPPISPRIPEPVSCCGGVQRAFIACREVPPESTSSRPGEDRHRISRFFFVGY